MSKQEKAELASFLYFQNGCCQAEVCRRVPMAPATFDRWLLAGLIKNPEPSEPVFRVDTRSGSTRGRWL